MTPGNCSGVRDQQDDSVRPLPSCQSCEYWLSTTGPRVYPLIQVLHTGQGVVIFCGRRLAVEAKG